jgi:hypothetical protein
MSPPPTPGPTPAEPPAHDEVFWMAIAIEAVAVVSALLFAWVQSR